MQEDARVRRSIQFVRMPLCYSIIPLLKFLVAIKMVIAKLFPLSKHEQDLKERKKVTGHSTEITRVLLKELKVENSSGSF